MGYKSALPFGSKFGVDENDCLSTGDYNALKMRATAMSAASAGTQSGATSMEFMGNIINVSTVAGNAYSVALPKAKTGKFLLVFNTGANAMQVFGYNGLTDTLNGVAGTTGLLQQPGTLGIYVSQANGAWEVGFLSLDVSGAVRPPTQSIAAAGNSLATGAALIEGVNFVSGADGTKGATLPLAAVGAMVYVKSTTGGSVCKVYPDVSGGIINGLSAAAAISMSSLTAAIFMCSAAGASSQWYTLPLLPS